MDSNLQPLGNPLDFDTIASFDGEPLAFWTVLAEFALGAFSADSVSLLLQARGGGNLRVLVQQPAGTATRLAAVQAEVATVTSRTPVDLLTAVHSNMIAFVIPVLEGSRIWMVVEGAANADEATQLAAAKEIRVLAELYLTRRAEKRTQQKLFTLSEVLDVGLALGECHRFGEAALRVCNEVAAQMVATRASLTWLDGAKLKLQATSHGGVIAKRSEASKALERLMEESFDQDDEVAYPSLEGCHVIDRVHQQFSREHEDVSVLSVPLRGLDGVCGVLCVEKAVEDGGWALPEVEKLRVIADLFAARLDDLHEKTGWFGRRLWRWFRKQCSRALGPEYTGWKLTGVALLLTLIVTAIVPMEHKVKAPFILKTDAASVVTAPFAGYIDAVNFHLGDQVQHGQLLVGLDQKELLLQRADTLAGRNKSANEVRSYQAEGKIAEMKVSQAQQEQAEARLNIIDHRLAQTEIRAPFDGVVVEGELREKLSSPVQVGEALFKVVQLKDLFGQLQADERDVSYLKAGLIGELAFSSRPSEKYSVRLDRFEPVAEVRSEGTLFLLRAQVESEPQDWWRPGMGGVCKIHVGKRSILWIATHRLVEVVRLWLWV